MTFARKIVGSKVSETKKSFLNHVVKKNPRVTISVAMCCEFTMPTVGFAIDSYWDSEWQ
jgi:hypothetical protein